MTVRVGWVLILMTVECWCGMPPINRTFIQGLDCRFPTKIRTALLEQVCREEELLENEVKPTTVHLLQVSQSRTIKGFRCTRQEDRFYTICGMFSHEKAYRTPAIGVNVPFPVNECKRAITRGLIQKESGNLLSISPNSRISYSFVKHGSIRTTSDNVVCSGSRFFLDGEEVSSVVERVAVHLLIEEIQVGVEADKLNDLTNQLIIPDECRTTTLCTSSEGTFMISQIPTCNLVHIRTLPMQLISIPEDGKLREVLVSKEHRILLRLKNERRAKEGCNPVRTYRDTDFMDIKVILRQEGQPQLTHPGLDFDSSVLDLELEFRIASQFLQWDSQNKLNSQLKALGARLCSVMQEAVDNYELSPYHKHALIRVRGDVVQELFCKPQRVEVRLGEQRGDRCYQDALPGWYGNQPVLVQARTHLIVEPEEVHLISCNNKFPPVFKALNNELIVAYPQVQIINLPLDHGNTNFLHLQDIPTNYDEIETGDFLYTQQEMTQFNHLIHFQRTKKQVIDNLVAQYCAGNPECGNYQPTINSNFQLEQLDKDITSPFSIFSTWRRTLESYGGLASIIVLFLLMLSLIYSILKVVWLIVFRRLNCARALQLGLMMDQTLLKELSRSSPDKNPSGHPSVPETDTLMPSNLPDNFGTEANQIVPYYGM